MSGGREMLQRISSVTVLGCLLCIISVGCGSPPGESPAPPNTELLTIDSLVPDTGSGKTQNFTVSFSDSKGYGNIHTMQLLINSTLNNVGACDVWTNSLGFYLFNDAGTVLEGPAKPNGSLTNSQCTIYERGSWVTGSGNSRSATFAITFSPAFSGAKHLYVFATSLSGQNTGFKDRGIWHP